MSEEEKNISYVRLCMVILTCIVLDISFAAGLLMASEICSPLEETAYREKRYTILLYYSKDNAQ